MTKKMLIDATHQEETRVAVVDNARLIDFDYESKFRKQLKGSIFLAKVTRVEPSLQAAFVNFGGNRHGFLPFSEIHPDYYRIPIADREAILAEQMAELEAQQAAEEAEYAEEEARAARAEAGLADEPAEGDVQEVGGEREQVDSDQEQESAEQDGSAAEPAEPQEIYEESDEDNIGNVVETNHADDMDEDGPQPESNESNPDFSADGNGDNNGDRGRRRRRFGRDRGRGRDRNRSGGRHMAAGRSRVEVVGGDGIEGDHPVRPSLRRHYKIQEVVKRGQIMLIQVSKEERGNKGAAVTTYLSLPGRYCVLMPNSPRGGGVSRKIANFKDRRRMRELMSELSVPQGMSVIMRTAGVERTKAEVKRDLDYLMRLWDNVRDLTLKSTAPSVIYEEGNLLKRAIRDLYGRDIEEIHVAGEEGFKSARNFMRMLMPSHVKKVFQYQDEKIPLFHKFQVENQIAAIGESVVTLRSGGYLVINPTEALVSIDVNSGRATKERHIEETAVKTNLEAAEEVARQLRLRDLGGLVVIDFIDMEDFRNNARVERRLKEALSADRARIQIGRISSFGLLEMSRQRMNPSLTEAQFQKCPHCQGIGLVRSVDSSAILALRALEDEGIKGNASNLILIVTNDVALYILNNKRDLLADIERRYNFSISVRVDNHLTGPGFRVEVSRLRGSDTDRDDEDEDDEDSDAPRQAQPAERAPRADDGQDDRGGRRRRRGRRGGRGRTGFRDDSLGEDFIPSDSEEGDEDFESSSEDSADRQDTTSTGEERREDGERGERGRRRRRRGGRNRDGFGPRDRDFSPRQEPNGSPDDALKPIEEPTVNADMPAAPAEAAPEKARPATRRRSPRRDSADAGISASSETPVTEQAPETPEAPVKAKPARRSRKKADTPAAEALPETAAAPAKPVNDDSPAPRKAVAKAETPRPYEVISEAAPADKKKGWWKKLMD